MNIGIIGLGLMGGSLGLSLGKASGTTIFGADKDPEVERFARDRGAISHILKDEDYSALDVVILCVFPQIANSVLQDVLPKLGASCIVCDICGVKRAIDNAYIEAKKQYPTLRFCGTHPMAGKERGGIANATGTLFENAFMILTPIDGDMETAKELEEIFLQVGFRGVVFATPDHHDKMIGYTSQLAHVVSSAYIKNPAHKHHVGFSAGSFADLSRVARLDAEMWTGLFLENSENLANHVDIVIEKLQEYSSALKSKNRDLLKSLLVDGTNAKEYSDKCLKDWNSDNE